MPSNGPSNGPRNGCRKRPQRGENTGLVCKTVLALGCGGSVDQCRGGCSGGGVGLCRGPPQRCVALPCCRHHNACPNPTGCFLHCPCPCTARQRGRGGKAVNPLSDLAACKCRNRVFQTAPASGHCVLQRLPQASAVQTGRQGGLPCKRGDSKTAVPGGSADPCRNLHRQWQKGHRRTC